MSNPKVFEFAKEIGMTPLALMDKIREWKLPVNSHMAELEPQVLEQMKVQLREPSAPAEAPAEKKTAARKKAPAAPKAAATAAPKAAATKTTATKTAAKTATPRDVSFMDRSKFGRLEALARAAES